MQSREEPTELRRIDREAGDSFVQAADIRLVHADNTTDVRILRIHAALLLRTMVVAFVLYSVRL